MAQVTPSWRRPVRAQPPWPLDGCSNGGREHYLWHISDPFAAHQVYQLECSSLEDSMKIKAKGTPEMEL